MVIWTRETTKRQCVSSNTTLEIALTDTLRLSEQTSDCLGIGHLRVETARIDQAEKISSSVRRVGQRSAMTHLTPLAFVTRSNPLWNFELQLANWPPAVLPFLPSFPLPLPIPASRPEPDASPPNSLSLNAELPMPPPVGLMSPPPSFFASVFWTPSTTPSKCSNSLMNLVASSRHHRSPPEPLFLAVFARAGDRRDCPTWDSCVRDDRTISIMRTFVSSETSLDPGIDHTCDGT